jgi:hypothetical protein
MDTIMADNDNFDMFKFGGLVNQVENLQTKVDAMDRDIKELLELANKSRGGFWMGMAIVSAISGVISFFAGLYHAK